MKNYLVSIIWISIIVAITEFIAPSLEGIKKYVRLIGTLCVVCIVIAPIISIGVNSNEIFEEIKDSITDGMDKEEIKKEYQDRLNQYLMNYSENEFKNEIYRLLKKEFDIPEDEADIKLFLFEGEKNLEIEKMQIILSENSIFQNPYNIEEYFSKIIRSKCEVLIA